MHETGEQGLYCVTLQGGHKMNPGIPAPQVRSLAQLSAVL